MAYRRVTRVLLGFCVLLAAPATGVAQTGSVVGRVQDATTGVPVASAVVQAFAVGGALSGSALTGDDGSFRLANLAPGAYALAVSRIGYATRRVEAVRVVAGETTTTTVEMSPEVLQMAGVVVSASKKMEKVVHAPASVSIVGETAILERPALTPVEHLKGLPGLDVITTGVQATNVATRGFNNIFSGSLHTLTDYRLAGVPSLRVNLLHFIPMTDEDLERMELVLGPGSALYGPNTASGVLHLMTKSPLIHQGTAASVSGGERDVLHGAIRTSHLLSENVGFKISAEMLSAQEWAFVDPVEVAEAAKFEDPMLGPLFRQNLMTANDLSAEEADRRIARIGQRDNDVERWGGEARVDWRVTEDFTTILSAGMANLGTGIELTGLGAGQVEDWRNSFVQARANWKNLFVQGYVNASDAGNTFLLRNGAPIVDKSRLYVGQIQHGWPIGERQNFTYGADVFYTDPRTEGTINGIYEDEDQTTEVGAYVQSETALSSRFDLVLAGRVDFHSALPDPVFSPRAAIVFKPSENQSIRATFNRAFSTPTSLNQFLDLGSAIPDNTALTALGYSLRVQGTGDRGFSFGGEGGFQMRSPTVLGAPNSLIPADATLMWDAAVQVVANSAGLSPQLVAYMQSIDPNASQVGSVAWATDRAMAVAIENLDIPDIAPIRESTTTTFEVGYKGVLRERLVVSADLWFSRNDQFVTPLTVYTPFVSLDRDQNIAYLRPRLMAVGLTQEQADAIAAGMAQIPLGVISSEDVNATDAQLLATYTNVDEQIDYWGTDIATTLLLNSAWSVKGAASWVSDDHFVTDEVGIVTLNAPTLKWSLGAQYRNGGFNGELRGRFNNEFPVQSGVYAGTACIDGGSAPTQSCVEEATLVDLVLGYQLPFTPGASVQLNISNLLDEDYRSYPGAPLIGRMALLRLRYAF